jgi:hypothetical protein
MSRSKSAAFEQGADFIGLNETIASNLKELGYGI